MSLKSCEIDDPQINVILYHIEREITNYTQKSSKSQMFMGLLMNYHHSH